MKKAFLTIFLILCILSLTATVQARSGCCSHHQGVCGCGCCDGTPLSSICAPYYPECSSGNTNVYTPYIPPPTYTPIPTLIPTDTPTPTPTQTPTQSQVLGTEIKITPTPLVVNYGASTFWTLALLGALGYGGYRYIKSKKTDNTTSTSVDNNPQSPH